MVNRQQRLAALKAIRCLKRGTKVPGGVLAKLHVPGIQKVAEEMGKEIDARGKVWPLGTHVLFAELDAR